MIKKIVLVCCLILMSGCSYVESITGASSTEETVTQSLQEAQEIAEELDMLDNLEQLRDRNVLGMIFQGYEVYSEAAVLLNADGISDTVGVFYVTDLEAALGYIEEYVENLKSQTTVYDASELFKIDKAVIKDNGSDKIVLIIANDIVSAEELAEEAVQ